MKLFPYFLLLPSVIFGQSIFQDTEKMLANKQFSKAETQMERYVTEHPNDLKGIELLGDVYGQQKKWDDAIIQYKKLVDASPKNANYHYKYGGVMGMKALEVNKFKAAGMIGDLKTAFHKAADLDPKHIDARWALVKLYMQLPGIVGGSKSKALKYADEIDQLSKVDGFLAKAYIHNEVGDYTKAEAHYKKALAIGGSETCYRELTQFYINHDKHLKALHYLKEGYKIHNSEEFLQQINTLEN